jgi:7 transmembrane receptor (rhodopsin family)
LLSAARGKTTLSLLIFFPLFAFVLGLPNNLFSLITLRRQSCLRQGVGHYLLWMSIINQLSLALLTARLIHIMVIITMSRSSQLVDDLFCKLLSYLLTCLTRLSSWLPAFVALERVYTTIFLSKHWFKQPRIARSLMLLTFALVFLSAVDELVFVKSFTSIEDANSTMCVIEYPSRRRSMWISIHQVVAVSHFLLPLVINLCSTLTIMSIIIKNKMNIRGTEKCKFTIQIIK